MRGGVVLAVVVAGLVVPAAGAQGPPPHTPDPDIADGSAQRALDDAKATWRAQRIRSYRFRLQVGCFCPPESRGPVTLTVRDGRRIRPPRQFADLATIGRLHRVVQRAIDAEAEGLHVRYDRRGMPTTISIDGRRMIADDEISYAADRFRRLRRR